jgi:hypothetical protein
MLSDTQAALLSHNITFFEESRPLGFWEESVTAIFRLERTREGGTFTNLLASPETAVLTRPTHRHLPECGILHIHRRENLKPFFNFFEININEI